MPWNAICEKLMVMTHSVRCLMVKWERPATQELKLNTDGSRLANGSTGARGIIRDHQDNLVMAVAKSLEMGSNNCAEASATLIVVNGATHMALLISSWNATP